MGIIFASMMVDYDMMIKYTYTHGYDVRLEEVSEQIALNIRNNMNDAITYVSSMTEVFSEYEDIHCEEALDLLARVSERSEFTRMWLTKENGEAISSEGNTSNATGRGYLEDAKNGNSGISELQYSRVNGEKNVVIYAPINHNNEVTGLVIGIYRLDDLLNVIDIHCFGRSGYCKLITESGEVIVEAEDSGTDFAVGPYDHMQQVEINDWYVYVQMPMDIVVDDLKRQGFFYILIFVKLAVIIIYFIVDRNRTKKSILEKMALMDSLTALWNRKALEDKVNSYLRKQKQDIHILFVLDIDHFKEINDTVGHLAGDNIIKKIARELENHFGDKGFVGRLGGDEFAVFIPKVKDIEELKVRMNYFLEKMDDITVSVGMSAFPEEGNNFDVLYESADSKMYRAKAVKGNSLCTDEL